MTVEEIDFRAANPYVFSKGQIQISGCYGGWGGWNWDIQLIYDGQDYGWRRYAPRIPGYYYMEWAVHDGLVKITEVWRAGECTGTNIGFKLEYPCTGQWRCEPGQTGFEIDGCGNRREKLACAYREASLVSCSWPQNPIAGQTYQVIITVNQGSKDENYKLVFTGDFTGESAPFMVNAGTGQRQFTVGNIIFSTGGSKSVTATLVKS